MVIKGTTRLKLGFFLSAIVVISLNAWSYFAEKQSYINREIHFAHGGFYWGFPYKGIDEGTCFPCEPIWSALLINVVAAFALTVVGGFVFEFLTRRFRRLK